MKRVTLELETGGAGIGWLFVRRRVRVARLGSEIVVGEGHECE